MNLSSWRESNRKPEGRKQSLSCLNRLSSGLHIRGHHLQLFLLHATQSRESLVGVPQKYMSTLIRVPVKLTNMVRQHVRARIKIEGFYFQNRHQRWPLLTNYLKHKKKWRWEERESNILTNLQEIKYNDTQWYISTGLATLIPTHIHMQIHTQTCAEIQINTCSHIYRGI